MEKLQKFITLNLIAILGYMMIALFIYYNLKYYNPHLFYLCFANFVIMSIIKFHICFQAIFAVFIIELITRRFCKEKYEKLINKIPFDNKVYDFLFRLGIFLIIAQFLMIINIVLSIGSSTIFNSDFIDLIVLVLPFFIVGFFIFRKQG